METNQNGQTNTEANSASNENEASANTEQAAANGSTEPTVESLMAELEDSKNKYLYLYAEFDTFKKRAIKERSDLVKFGNENIVREMLSVLDNLERALEHAQNPSAMVDGIKMVAQQFKDILGRFGVKTVDSVGKKFDPEMHEAIAQEESKDVPSGHVLKVHQHGYTINGRLLRPAKVVVATDLKN